MITDVIEQLYQSIFDTIGITIYLGLAQRSFRVAAQINQRSHVQQLGSWLAQAQ